MPFEPPVPQSPTPRLGPLLFFRGCDARRWRLRALILRETPPPALEADGRRHAWQRIWQCGDAVAWAADFELPRGGPVEGPSGYAIGLHSWRVTVPASGAALHLACLSCNGEEDESPEAWRLQRDAAWHQLAGAHATRPYHLMLQMGDQLYADPVWSCDPRLEAWRGQRRNRRAQAECPPDLLARLRTFYRDRYLATMGGAAQARLYAEVPQIGIWDDHDIFDGWGSWRDSDQSSPLFRGIFQAARESFLVFQRGEAPEKIAAALPADGPPPPLDLTFAVDDALLAVPDLRSERRRDRVMGPEGWRRLDAALDRARKARRLLLVTSVPFLNANLSPLERLFVLVPGQQLYQDDLRDQWTSYAHRDEWRRLHGRLADLVARGVEVTSLSGEIHLGALGRAEVPGGAYLQAISPGIAHRPPPPAFVRVLERLARAPSSPGARAGLVPLPGHGGRRYLAERGWIDLELPPGAPARLTWRGPEADAMGIAVEHPGATVPA